MFKGNLLKRVVPFLLSLAMAFQSVPMTALAVEDPQAAEVTEDTGTTVESVEETTEDSEDQAGTEAGENAETTPADTDAETGEDTDVDEDAAQPGKEAQAVVNSTEISVDGLSLPSGFTREQGESSLTYTTSYSQTDQFSTVMNAVKSAAVIKVNGESQSGLKADYLLLEWRETGKTEAMTGTPQNVGSYVLHLETRVQEGICGKAEKDVYFNITPKELTFSGLDSVVTNVKAGSKVAEFKETVAKAGKLMARDQYGYFAEFTALQYTIAVKVNELKDGAEEETTDTLFNKNKDYRVKVEVAFADADAAKNYEVTGGEFLVKFAGLLATKVEIKNPGKEMVETYDKEKTYAASEMATKYGVTAEVKVTDTEESLGEVAAKWYTKEINKSGDITDFPTSGGVDGITQFYWGGALYTLMTAESETEEAKVGDVGDYYLVFMYEGVDGQYEKSHSDPLKVTIDPIEVILKPTAVSELNTAMTGDEIKSALAQVESKLYIPDTTDSTLAGTTESDAPIADKDFYGVSYENTGVTQYYSPVFELVRKTRNKLPEASWPANATEEQKWGKWTGFAKASKIEKDTDTEQYKYFVIFTGEKAVYDAEGKIVNSTKRPITEATDAANRNYKVKTDSDTLANEKNMLEVTLGETKETSIDVSKIIEEFNKEGGRGKGGAGLDAGDPAWTIYDADLALFADKASYKKAIVTGTNPEIKDTDKDLTYTWQSSSVSNAVDRYYEITRMEKTADETDEDFAKRKNDAVKALEDTFRDSSTIPQNAGLYRLHVAYKDTSLVPKNAPADGYAYFLIKKQELMLVADTQYAKYDDYVYNFSQRGYSVYALTDNDESKLDLDKPLNWYTGYVDWQAMNLKKNADGSDATEWEVSTGTFIKNEAHPYVYKAAVYLDNVSGSIQDVDGNVVTNKAGNTLYWSNYTTKNMAAWDEDADDYKQHIKVGDGYGDFMFDAAGVKIVVDRTKLFDDKIYDGKSIANELPAGFVTLTDENGAAIPETKLQINGEPKDGIGTVRVEWKWVNSSNDSAIRSLPMPIGEVRFGGTYRLVANFEGYCYEDGTAYSPLERDWDVIKDKDDKPYEFTIKPLDVEITPILTEEATAGETVSEMLENWHVKAEAVGSDKKIPDGTDGSEDDTWLFNRGSGTRWNAVSDTKVNYSGYPILNGNNNFAAAYYADNDSVGYNDRIRYGKKYDVKLSAGSLFAQYAYSYNLTYKPATLAKINRGDAEVWSTPFFTGKAVESRGKVSIYWEKNSEDGTYKIVPREGIPFVYKEDTLTYSTDLITNKVIPKDKNYIAVDIVSPCEFDSEFSSDYSFAENNFVYGNSIKSAGGYVIAKNGRQENGVKRYFITALFPVELDESGKIKEIPAFSVTWEKGYTDTFKFDLTNAQVEANLKSAVAPKSLAFNAVQAKMAVGEEQQLDVKITKAQLGDVIRINYRLAGGTTSNKYASINPETGLITALATENKKPTAVNVEAYPVRLAADGKTFEEITGKGVKVAKTKVTITEVTAPVIKKVIPQDTSAEVQFTKVDDGYRGEIYVVKLENKKDANKWKAADFETKIGEMKNGQWKGTFAIEPKYLTGQRGYNEKLKLCRQWISTLEKGAYVVYVRNVSAVRTLADGSKTTESAAGTVKMFETTKSQVKALNPYFEVVDPKTKTNPVRYTNGKDSSNGYTVELADKSAQLLVEGQFSEKALNEAADKSDNIWYQLSLKVAEKALGTKLTDTYLDPKLSFYVTDNVLPSFDEKGKITNSSKYVTISNKGKLTFKGVDKNGELKVRVYVYADNGYRNYCNLTITARPDTVTTKKVKTMKVGDAIRLRDYLEYKKGKTKVPNFWSSDIEITNRSEVENAGFEIYQAKSDGETHSSVDGSLRAGEFIIIAKKDGAKCDLKLKDRLWMTADSDEKTQSDEKTISLATTKLDPVKGLKTVYTDDTAITLNFAHAGHPEAFDIEVKDARGSVVYKRLAYRDDALNHKISANDYAWRQNFQRARLTSPNTSYNFMYFEKTKTYAYTIDTDKLMRLSSYTISVTPVYDGERAAKPATTKAKTTNIPASHADGDIVNPDNTFWGVTLSFNYKSGTNRAYLTSGNTYTVTTGANDELAQRRGTDTLTWKSSNTKVASIKANQGSFTATLKALQQGKTTITVTSKVTKKTIARYHIAVKAVGKANGYGGDYENGGNGFYDDFIITVDPYYEGRMEVLTVSNSVTVTDEDYLNSDPAKDRTWVKFTSPSYGEYTFNCDKACKIYYTSGSEAGDTASLGSTYVKTLRLEEGQTIYFKIIGSFKLSVSSYTDFTKLTTAFTEEKPLQIGNKETWVSFTATEDNYYTFNGDRTLQFEQDGSSISLTSGYKDGWNTYEKGMKAGETIFIKVSAGGKLYVIKREFTNKEPLAAGGKAAMSFTKDNKDDTQYVKFTAGPAGEYTFTYKPSDKIDVKFLAVDGVNEYYDGDAVIAPKITTYAEDTADTPAEATATLFMDAGETIVITVSVKSGQEFADDTKIDVEISAKASGVKDLAAEQTVTKDTAQMFAYTIPNDKAATKYTLTATEGATVTWYYNYCNWSGSLAQITSIYNNSFTVADGEVVGSSNLKAGDKIYIKVEAASDKDSKVTLTSVTDSKTFDAAKPASVVLGANGDAEWYTFTVKKAGYYEFSKKVTVAPEGSAAQRSNVMLVEKAFSTTWRTSDYVELNGDSDVTSGVRKLSAGDYVFMIQAADNPMAEGAKTTVALSVKEIVPTAIAKGDTEVKLAKGETKYYTFKAATDDNYTIQWMPGTDVGTPTVQYTTGDLAGGSYGTLDSTTVNNNYTYTIKVTADSAKDLSGKLQVAAKTTNFLTSGKMEDFTLTADEYSKTYKFTLPEDSALGYVVTVENTSTAPEGKTVPTITVQGDVDVSALGKGKETKEMTGWTTAFTTKTITITASDVTAAAEGVAAINATGKITIKPVTVQNLPTTAFKVKKGEEPGWYTYTVPTDGRYELDYAVGAEQDKSSVTVAWYKKNANGSQGSQVYTQAYLAKGQELYVKVAAGGTIADTGVDVTLKPALLKTTTLTLANGKAEADVTAEMVANGAVYYTFKAPEFASYTVKMNDAIYNIAEKYYPNKLGKFDWVSGSPLEKDDEILITVDTAGKLTVTQDVITELTLNQASKEITLKSGESASFLINFFKAGYYDFTVSDAAGLTVYAGEIYYEDDKRCYFVDYCGSGHYNFNIVNDAEEEAKLKVTARELTPVALKLGETSIPVSKDRVSVVEFRAPESYWYTVACSEGSSLEIMRMGDVFYDEDGERFGMLVYSGAEAAATAKVTIAKVTPAPASGEKVTVSLESGASKWYAYKTGKAGEYQFTPPTDVRFYCYKSMDKRDYSTNTSVKAGANTDLYIRIENNSGVKIESADIMVTCDAATELNVGANQLSNSGYTYMTFKAPEDGEYDFSSSDGSITYYGESVWQTSEYGSSHYIEKDSIVYLRVYSNDEQNVITVRKKTIEFLDHVSVESGQYQWITFKVPENGDYTFYSSDYTGDPKAWFFKNQDVGNNANRDTLDSISEDEGYGYNDDASDTRDFKKELKNLIAGETVYIAVGHYSLGSSTSCDVYVSY